MNYKLQEKVIELKNAVIELLQNCGKTISNEFDGFENNMKSNLGDSILVLIVMATIYEQKFNGKEERIYGKLIYGEVTGENISIEKLGDEATVLEKRISILNKIIKVIEEIEKELTTSKESDKNILSSVKQYKGYLQDCTKRRNQALSNLIFMCSKDPNYYSKIIKCLVATEDSQIKMMCDLYRLSELLTDKGLNRNLRKGKFQH